MLRNIQLLGFEVVTTIIVDFPMKLQTVKTLEEVFARCTKVRVLCLKINFPHSPFQTIFQHLLVDSGRLSEEELKARMNEQFTERFLDSDKSGDMRESYYCERAWKFRSQILQDALNIAFCKDMDDNNNTVAAFH